MFYKQSLCVRSLAVFCWGHILFSLSLILIDTIQQPHVQGAAAEQAQEGQEELLHVQGQKGGPWGDTPRPR